MNARRALPTVFLSLVFLVSPPQPQSKEFDMRVTTWQQDQFLTGRRSLYRWPGDFLSIDEFIPSKDGQRLERADSWSGHYEYPANFDEPLSVRWSHQFGGLFITGKDTSPTPDEVGTFYIRTQDGNISSIYTNGGPEYLGGNHKQNDIWSFGTFLFIGEDDDVYEVTSPIHSGASAVYDHTAGSHDAAIALLSHADTIWLLDDNDVIYQWNGTSFDEFFTPSQDLYVQHWYYYRGHFILFGRPNEGELNILQVDAHEPADIRELIRLPTTTGEYLPGYNFYGEYATPWALFEDAIYFSPGGYTNIGSEFEEVPIFRFAGSRVEHLDTVECPLTPDFWGLVPWRERLLLYFGDSGDQRVYVYHNGRFIQYLDSSYTTPDEADIYSAGGYLLMPTTQNAKDGITVSRRPATTNVFTSSWLDMNHPASKKHLIRVAAIVSDAVADFKVKIEYRTEGGSWTEAVEEANARHVDAGNIGVDFYALQLRVTFTDDTGNYEDVKLESIAATFSYGVP